MHSKRRTVNAPDMARVYAQRLVVVYWHLYPAHHEHLSLPWTPVEFRSKVDEYLDAIRGICAGERFADMNRATKQ